MATLLLFLPGILKLIIGGAVLFFVVNKCSSYMNTYDKIRIAETQKKAKEKAEREAAAVKKEDFKRIEKLNSEDLTLEEKHKLLQEIGTK